MPDQHGAVGADDLCSNVIRIPRSPVRLDVRERPTREPHRVQRGIRRVSMGVARVTEHGSGRRDTRDVVAEEEPREVEVVDRRLEHHVRDAARFGQVRRLAVAMDRPDEERFAEHAGDDESFCFGVRRVIAPHEADLKPGRSALRRGEDAIAVGEREPHRFLKQHVPAAGESRDRLLSVELSGRRDDDDQDVVAAE